MKSVLCILVLVLAGCAHNPAQLRPGAFNLFDQNAHDILRTAHDTLAAAATEVVNFPAAKPAYNAAVDALNAAQAGYKAYHAALERHEAPDQSSVQALIEGLNAAIAKYLATKKPVASLWDGRVYA